ncbi:hypothetical protein D3C78_1516290 [compost metagenome]
MLLDDAPSHRVRAKQLLDESAIAVRLADRRMLRETGLAGGCPVDAAGAFLNGSNDLVGFHPQDRFCAHLEAAFMRHQQGR